MLLNLLMYACLIASTNTSLPITIKNGDSTSPDNSHVGSTVKLCGSIVGLCSGIVLLGSEPPTPAPGTDSPPTSTTLRIPMMRSMTHSWNRSTMSAQVSWKRLSFSKRLKTVLLTSTNWFDMRSVRSAFEYEFTATLSVMHWK